MTIVYWAMSELMSYTAWAWLLFVVITIVLGFLLRKPGLILARVLVAIAIVALDVQWIQSEMRKPDWAGAPDQDSVFLIGVALRVVLVNTVLLPVGLLVCHWRAERLLKADSTSL